MVNERIIKNYRKRIRSILNGNYGTSIEDKEKEIWKTINKIIDSSQT